MGIKTIFSEKDADIRMLASNEPVFVSKAVQKAVIEVDESGTKAAASTALVMQCCSGGRPRREKFTADRPFLLLLRSHRIPLFLGVYQGKASDA